MSSTIHMHVETISTEVRSYPESVSCHAHDTVTVRTTDRSKSTTDIVLFLPFGAGASAGMLFVPPIPQPKPFSTYPEDRAKMLALCNEVDDAQYEDDVLVAARRLSDLVRAILTDEAVSS